MCLCSISIHSGELRQTLTTHPLAFLEACVGLNLFTGAWFLVTHCTKCYHPGCLLTPSVSFGPFHAGTKGNLGELA